MERNKQNAIFKTPVPLLVGNITLSSTLTEDYTYLYYYIVDDEDSETTVIFFDSLQNEWCLFYSGYSYSYYDNNYFPQLSCDLGIYSMNGYVNNDAGYPVFYGSDQYGDKQKLFYFDKELNEWCFGVPGHNISGDVFAQNCIDVSDQTYGNAPAVSSYYLTSFIPDETQLTPAVRNYKLITGNIRTPGSLLTFKNSNNEVLTGKIIHHIDSMKRSSTRSPQIISGEPCLGYYFENEADQNEDPYVIGSICIGTNDLTSVPPLVGHNEIVLPDGSASDEDSDDVFPGMISGDWSEAAYWWVGTTIDKTKTQWNLYQILTTFPAPRSQYTYILLSGGYPNTDPCTAEKFWYMNSSNYGNLFNYNKLKNGITFTAYPNGNSIQLNIVGLTNASVDSIKHTCEETKLKMPIYIGNWIAPQPTWRTQ